MATFEKIATVEVGVGGASTIDFTSIPSTYTDLLLKISVRSSASGGGGGGSWDYGTIKFNGSSSSYTERFLYGQGTGSAISGNAASADFWSPYSGATASTFGNTEIYIPNYASANYKSISIDTTTENNATAAFAGLNAALWSNTAAITSIALALGSGNFVQYSTATLYGIKKA